MVGTLHDLAPRLQLAPRLYFRRPDDPPPSRWAATLPTVRPANFVLVNWWEGVDLRHLYYSSPHRRPQHLSQLQRPAFACVWELDVVLHEQQARIRHVLAVNPSQTGDYLADLYVWPPKNGPLC